MFHFAKLFIGAKFDGDFHDYLKCWLLGEVCYGKYSEHLLSWWPHRNDPNVLFLVYEEMKEDIVNSIMKIAEFINPSMKLNLINNEDILEKIVKHSEFNHMKETTSKGFKKRYQSEMLENYFDFFRKGIIGDWKNHFTEEENQLVNSWFYENFQGTGIEKLWNKYKIFD